MSTIKDLIYSIAKSDAVSAEQQFAEIMQDKMAEQLGAMRQEVGSKMFDSVEESEQIDEGPKADALQQGVAEEIENVTEDPVSAALIGGALGIAASAKGAHHAAKHTNPNSKTPVRDFIGNFAKGIVDPRTYVPKKKSKQGVKKEEVEQIEESEE